METAATLDILDPIFGIFLHSIGTKLEKDIPRLEKTIFTKNIL